MDDKKSEAVGASDDRLKRPEANGSGETSKSVAIELSPAPAGSDRSTRRTPGNPSGKAESAGGQEQGLGEFLAATRESRGLSAEDITRETRIPAHYLRMMETSNYAEISDQLYLVPFLRRYADYLKLDPEEIAMRFVREVQRADSVPPARLDQPLESQPRGRRGWAGAVLVIGFLAIAASAYLYESNRHRQTGMGSVTSQPVESGPPQTGESR